MAEFSQLSWLKTTNPISLRPSFFRKRLKENINPNSAIWQSSCLLTVQRSFEAKAPT